MKTKGAKDKVSKRDMTKGIVAKYKRLVPAHTKLRYKYQYVVANREQFAEHAANKATREMFRKLSKQREHIGSMIRKVGALNSDLCKCRRYAKRIADEAARLKTIISDYEQAFTDMIRLQWRGKTADMPDLIPEHIQLAVREEYEPRKGVVGTQERYGTPIGSGLVYLEKSATVDYVLDPRHTSLAKTKSRTGLDNEEGV